MMLLTKSKYSFRAWLKIGVWLMLSIIVIGVGITWQLAKPVGRGGELIQFTIKRGESVNVISENLKQVKLINSKFWFETWVWLTGNESNIITGSYSLPSNINLINLTRIISGGIYPTADAEIQIIEGWTIKKIASYLEDKDIVKANDFIKFTTTVDYVDIIRQEVSSNILSSLPIDQGLEGYLFPDTYRIFYDASVSDIAVKMIDNLGSKFSINWQNVVNKKGYSIHQALTLASIIEMEVASDKDRALVADIFIRRLKANMGLQADSTINYITGKSHSSAQLSDLLIDSPYNTYKYKGLPPGPISNPSESSIKAVVYPEANPYWYFLTTNDGKVIYSKTFEEHRQAKFKYLN